MPAEGGDIRILDVIRSVLRSLAAAPAVPIEAEPVAVSPPPRPSTLSARATELLPRMVARIGAVRFTADESDFIDELPELRTAARVAPPNEAGQIELMCEMARDYATQFRPQPATFPALALRVMDRAQDRKAGTEQIVSLVAQDAAVSAAVLRVANSVALSRREPVHHIRTAVARLGLDEVRRIAAAIAARSLYDIELVSEFKLFRTRWQQLFLRSMTVAFSAGWLASQLRTGAPERAFLGGMFHDIGKTLALRTVSALLMGGRVPFEPSDAVIDGVLESLHVEVGVAMHQAWKLPDDLTTICRTHHAAAPPLARDEPARVDLEVVQLCSALAQLHIDPTGAASSEAAEVVRASLRGLRLPFKQYRALTARVTAFREQVSAMFGLEDEPAAQAQAAESQLGAP